MRSSVQIALPEAAPPPQHPVRLSPFPVLPLFPGPKPGPLPSPIPRPLFDPITPPSPGPFEGSVELDRGSPNTGVFMSFHNAGSRSIPATGNAERAVGFWELKQGRLMVEATFRSALVTDCDLHFRRRLVRFDEPRLILHPIPG